MASQEKTNQLTPSTGNNSFAKIDRFFDTAEHIVERSGSLLSKSEAAFIKLFLLVHLVIDLVVVLIFVLIYVLTK
jgi:hypothetical protein